MNRRLARLSWLGLAASLPVAGALLARRWCTVVTVRGHRSRAGGEPRPAALAGSALAEVVPAGQLAVAGDNAERSQDSRHLAYIAVSDVCGRVRIRQQR